MARLLSKEDSRMIKAQVSSVLVQEGAKAAGSLLRELFGLGREVVWEYREKRKKEAADKATAVKKVKAVNKKKAATKKKGKS